MSRQADLTPSDKSFHELMQDMMRRSLANPNYAPEPINCRCTIVNIDVQLPGAIHSVPINMTISKDDEETK